LRGFNDRLKIIINVYIGGSFFKSSHKENCYRKSSQKHERLSLMTRIKS